MKYLMAGHCVTVLTAHQISRGVFSKDGAGTIFIIELWVNIFRKDYQIFGDLAILIQILTVLVVRSGVIIMLILLMIAEFMDIMVLILMLLVVHQFTVIL